MKYYFVPKIEINTLFTDEEFELLDEAIRNSEYEYFAVTAGEWWHEIKKRRYFFKDSNLAPIEITFRNLDKLIKTLEPYVNYLDNKKAFALSNKIANVLRACNEKAEQVNELFTETLTEI